MSSDRRDDHVSADTPSRKLARLMKEQVRRAVREERQRAAKQPNGARVAGNLDGLPEKTPKIGSADGVLAQFGGSMAGALTTRG